jgi:hypothetical protein
VTVHLNVRIDRGALGAVAVVVVNLWGDTLHEARHQQAIEKGNQDSRRDGFQDREHRFTLQQDVSGPCDSHVSNMLEHHHRSKDFEVDSVYAAHSL